MDILDSAWEIYPDAAKEIEHLRSQLRTMKDELKSCHVALVEIRDIARRCIDEAAAKAVKAELEFLKSAELEFLKSLLPKDGKAS